MSAVVAEKLVKLLLVRYVNVWEGKVGEFAMGQGSLVENNLIKTVGVAVKSKGTHRSIFFSSYSAFISLPSIFNLERYQYLSCSLVNL